MKAAVRVDQQKPFFLVPDIQNAIARGMPGIKKIMNAQ
jgi:hypothetical protein